MFDLVSFQTIVAVGVVIYNMASRNVDASAPDADTLY